MNAVARAEVRLSALEWAIVESIAYADVFDFPVTAGEIRRALPFEASIDDVEVGLAAVADYVTGVEPHYVLQGREVLVLTRQRRALGSRRLMRRAGFYGRLIKRLPYVRMVAVSGSLAADNAEDGDDVDYLIVTAPGRVWLARALTIAVVRLARLRGLTLCPNYILAETALALSERDAYTARELLQMRPLAGHDVYVRMLAANAWCAGLLPNWEVEPGVGNASSSVLKRLAEMLLGGRFGDALERSLLRRKGGELRARAADNGEAVFDENVCKGHFDAHRARLEAALAERLTRLGLLP